MSHPATLPYRVIWVTGMPRAGSTWLYNVVRDIVALHGLRALPEHQLTDGPNILKVAEPVIRAAPPDAVCVIKTHGMLPQTLPVSRFLAPVRDVREATLSFIRFMRGDVASAPTVAKQLMDMVDHYAAFPTAIARLLPYGEICSEPAFTARVAASFLGLPISAEAAATITARYESSTVQRLIAETESAVQRRVAAGQTLSLDEAAYNIDQSRRARDPVTGFQSGHFSGGARWREFLNPEQAARLDSMARPWLARYGLPLD